MHHHLEHRAPLYAGSLANGTPQALPARRVIAWRSWYLRGLTWAFMLLTAARLLAYSPTVLAIIESGDSRQHSLWTWLIWVGANLTMAAWMYEHNAQCVDKAIGVSLANAAACGLTSAVILWYRF